MSEVFDKAVKEAGLASLGEIPSPFEVARKLGLNIPTMKDIQNILSFVGPQADIQAMVEESSRVIPAFKKGDISEALSSLGLAALVPFMLGIPGTPSGIKKGGLRLIEGGKKGLVKKGLSKKERKRKIREIVDQQELQDNIDDELIEEIDLTTSKGSLIPDKKPKGGLSDTPQGKRAKKLQDNGVIDDELIEEIDLTPIPDKKPKGGLRLIEGGKKGLVKKRKRKVKTEKQKYDKALGEQEKARGFAHLDDYMITDGEVMADRLIKDIDINKPTEELVDDLVFVTDYTIWLTDYTQNRRILISDPLKQLTEKIRAKGKQQDIINFKRIIYAELKKRMK
jgi:hypothetical protein